MKRYIPGIAVIFGLAFLFYFSSLALAVQGPIGVSISPLKWELSADPGQVLYQKVTAINPNDFVLKVVPEFQDFRVLENAGIQWIPSDVENPYRMIDWIRISTEPITLKPKGQTDVPFTIVVPRNASVGGHYAAIFFRAVIDPSGGNIGSIPRVGALIVFNVNGQVKKSGEITHFSAPRFINRGPISFNLSLKNTGTTHYLPKTEITVQNIFGPRVKIEAEKDKFLYPGVSRQLKAVWSKSFPLGIYFAKANFTDGDGNLHSQSAWFIGFPWKYFLTLFAIVVALRYLFLWLKRKFKIVRVA